MNCKLAPPYVNVYSEQFYYKTKNFLQNGQNSCDIRNLGLLILGSRARRLRGKKMGRG